MPGSAPGSGCWNSCRRRNKTRRGFHTRGGASPARRSFPPDGGCLRRPYFFLCDKKKYGKEKAPGEPSEWFPGTPPPGQWGPLAPHWIPPHMLPDPVISCRTPVPRPTSPVGVRRGRSPFRRRGGFPKGTAYPVHGHPEALGFGVKRRSNRAHASFSGFS